MQGSFTLHCIGLHCIAMYFSALHWILKKEECIAVLKKYCIRFFERGVLHCIALDGIVLQCISVHCIGFERKRSALHCTALHCIALHCIALHYITLYYIALYCIGFFERGVGRNLSGFSVSLLCRQLTSKILSGSSS